VNAIPSRHLSPIAKLVFYALATKACGTNRTVWMSDGAIARRCGVSRPSVVAGLRQLLAVGLVEKVGLPVNQVQAYRICHPMFGTASGEADASESAGASKAAAPFMRSCATCHRPCNRLTRAGVCRGCKADSDLAAQVKEVRAELGPDASPEQIAARMKEIAEDRGRRRLTARVRRVMAAVA
jgi:DNA-binding Lrp family transcriptional regulator